MLPNVEGRPSLSFAVVEAALRSGYGLKGSLVGLPGEWDQNLRLDVDSSPAFVIKFANTGVAAEALDFQNAALRWLGRRWSSADLVPQLVRTRSGKYVHVVFDEDRRSYRMRVLTYLKGEPLRSIGSPTADTLTRLGQMLGDLDRCLMEFTHPAAERELRWDLRQWNWITSHTGCIRDLRRRGIVECCLLQFRARLGSIMTRLPISIIHNDANDDNVLFEMDGSRGWVVAGLVDYGDMARTWTVSEIAIAAVYSSFHAADPIDTLLTIAGGYHSVKPLIESEIQALFPLMILRLCVSVTAAALAGEEDVDNPHRQVSEQSAWRTLERLEPVDWLEVEGSVRGACGLKSRPLRSDLARQRVQHSLEEERRLRIGPSLSLSYQTPLEIVRGRGQFLFESNGRAYLDCVNNVGHVGHSHPKVVRALARQAAILNTNTRYLNPLLVRYARRLTATLPEPLRVCYFVNSGSEANELAVRIGRTCTGRRDVMVLDGAYHGNTQTLVDLSPYKSEGPGGQGLAPWAHKVPTPDPYRGLHRGISEKVGHAYAEYVKEMCCKLVREGRPPGVFICESMLSCAGQIVFPPGYLRDAFHHVRAVGGLCVVDEVQVGLGRIGTHMWAFQAQGVEPDIVTIGKPIGNGHPLAAVVTSPAIAEAFNNGMEYFSTFGGNPVSMAVGLAVLDVIEEEELQEQALRVGLYLKKGFNDLAEGHFQIGDVRGQGLFLGVELVEDRESLEPATKLTTWVIERAKADGVLLSQEGPYQNILKIKPPLVFDESDADLVLGVVDRALLEWSRRGLS